MESMSIASESQMGPEVDSRFEFRILLASDIHLGYQDRSTERRNDSFNAFEEVLKTAHEQEVQFVLLAGDLFHVNDPPKWVVKESIRLLRKYCYGDRDIDFRLSSDQSKNFADSDTPRVNYEDPNINVSMPVFTIHGNHDDPVGVQHESVVKLLSSAGLINYFGRVKDFTEIELEPLLFERARSRIAIYGLGSIRDERLNTLFREGKVHFKWPPKAERWFKILLLHQNRIKRGPGNYIPDSYLPKELDVVVWGHEHECLIDFQWNGHFRITQPGSTVATSLCAGEMAPKGCGVLRIMYDKTDRLHKCSLEKIPLQTPRQLYVEDVHFSSMPKSKLPLLDQELEFLREKIEELIEKSVGERSNHPKQPKKPLIRLRVFYGPDHETFLPHFVGRHFKEQIANPGECINFVRDRELWNKDSLTGAIDEDKFLDVVEEQKKSRAKIEDMINLYFKNATDENSRLHIIHEDAFSKAIQYSVEKGNPKDIIHKLIHESRRRMKEKLTNAEEASDENSILQYIREYKVEKVDEADLDVKGVIKELDKLPGIVKSEDIDDIDDTPNTAAKRGGRGRGRGRGRGAASYQIKEEPVTVIEDSDDDFGSPAPNSTRGRGRGGRGRGTRGSSAAAASSSARATSKSKLSDSDDDFESFIKANSSKSQKKITDSFGTGSRGKKRPPVRSPSIEDDDIIPSSLASNTSTTRSTVKKSKRVDVMAMLDDMN